jgi:hypothetical protein
VKRGHRGRDNACEHKYSRRDRVSFCSWHRCKLLMRDGSLTVLYGKSMDDGLTTGSMLTVQFGSTRGVRPENRREPPKRS